LSSATMLDMLCLLLFNEEGTGFTFRIDHRIFQYRFSML